MENYYSCTVNYNLIRAIQKITRILEHPVDAVQENIVMDDLAAIFSQNTTANAGHYPRAAAILDKNKNNKHNINKVTFTLFDTMWLAAKKHLLLMAISRNRF